MIAHLRGKIIHKSPSLSIIDCNGVGYEVLHTPFTSEKLRAEVVSLHIHTHIREDALQLFGFADVEEKRMFRDLLRVSSVGPKLALTVLSGLPYGELIEALRSRDLTRLQKIPGIGKKTAERLSLELGDKQLADYPVEAIGPMGAVSRDGELESVLLNLGYQKSEIQKVLSKVRSESIVGLEEKVKLALRELTNPGSARMN